MSIYAACQHLLTFLIGVHALTVVVSTCDVASAERFLQSAKKGALLCLAGTPNVGSPAMVSECTFPTNPRPTKLSFSACLVTPTYI